GRGRHQRAELLDRPAPEHADEHSLHRPQQVREPVAQRRPRHVGLDARRRLGPRAGRADERPPARARLRLLPRRGPRACAAGGDRIESAPFAKFHDPAARRAPPVRHRGWLLCAMTYCAIDFGTSNSGIALPSSDGSVSLVEVEPGYRTMPTAVFYVSDG